MGVESPTQVEYPWKATVRTVFAVTVAVLTLIPVVAVTAGISTQFAVVQVVAVAGAITRVLALPQVNDFLKTFVPWLAAN